MTDEEAPERIWAYSLYKAGPKMWRYIEAYHPDDRKHHDPTDDDVEYVRADTCATVTEERDALREALIEIDALDPEYLIDNCAQTAMRGLILRMGEIARASLDATKED